MDKESPCVCQSGDSYQQCCSPYHHGVSLPSTALQLMRSRYSAYALRLIDYLVETTHYDKLRPSYKTKLMATIHDTNWNGLEIVRTSLGQNSDKAGKVEFIASYIEDGEQRSMREHSRFKKYKNKWYYYDGKG